VKFSFVVFVVGCLVLVLTIAVPYPLLGAGKVFLAAGLLFLLVAPALAAAPRWLSETPLFTLLAVCPWVFAAVLITNGALDRSSEIVHQTVVIGQRFYGTCDAVTVRSWRPGRSSEELYLRTGRGFSPVYGLSNGKAAIVGVRNGAFGLPWVSRVSQGPNGFDFSVSQ
jgi:hypothetical protein